MYRDCQGRLPGDVRALLPARVLDWPPARAVKCPALLRACHQEMSQCAACQETRDLELHHLIGGRMGRSDERTNLLPLCRACHDAANSPALPLPKLLALKWRHEPEAVDWLRLTLLHRRYLPELCRLS